MGKSLSLILSALIIASGCTHNHVFDRSLGSGHLDVTNAMTVGREAEVVTEEGQVFRWADVRFGVDSTYFSVAGTGLATERRAFETRRISEVTVRSKSRGALEGLGIGALIGGTAGAALIVGVEAVFCTETSGTTCDSPSVPLAALSGAVGGAVWGSVIGWIRTSRTRIRVR